MTQIKWLRIGSMLGLVLLLIFVFTVKSTHAQWPPFRFQMTPTLDQNTITYTLKFSKRVDGPLADVTFKIPIPEGTRFLEATAQATTEVTFDGQEVTFFTSTVHRSLNNLNFTVEVTDPTRTTFTTIPWISWKGNPDGNYLVDEIALDLNKEPLAWVRPGGRLRLEARALVEGDVITYEIYPVKRTGRRMWDLEIMVPLPPGTTLLTTKAPAPFVADFDGREVTFSTIEFDRNLKIGPLVVEVSTAGVTTPFAVTHSWARWKNVGRSVGRSVVLQETIRGGDLVVRPGISQLAVSDAIGDVPFSNYDLTSVALHAEPAGLEVLFHTADSIEPEDERLEFIVYLDTDCSRETGPSRGGRGADYWLRYRQASNKAQIYTWDEVEEGWLDPVTIEFDTSPDDRIVRVWLPSEVVALPEQFCWVGRTRNRNDAYNIGLRSDWLGSDTRLTQYTLAKQTVAERLDFADLAKPVPWGILGENEPDIGSPVMRGKLAVPLSVDQEGYQVHIFSLPDGGLLDVIPEAHQPQFRSDGQALLINHHTSIGPGPIYEYHLANNTRQQVSDWPHDSHPAYSPGGDRIVYGNDELTLGADGQHHPYLFVQCGLLPPHLESETHCQQIPQFGILIPAGQIGEIRGSHPLWTSKQEIVYNGCNSWAGYAACGIYSVAAESTKRDSDGYIPQRLTAFTSDIPTDSKRNLITFMSQRDGNWEVYVMNLNGDEVQNLSNSPTSVDGLPTLSPDGQWVAFVSDREGGWAVWVVPVSGGDVRKLIDLPANQSLSRGDDLWIDQRISWGP